MALRIDFLLLGLATLSAFGQTPLETSSAPMTPIIKGQTIYACHHSFFLLIPPILQEVAKSGGYPDQDIIGIEMIGGSKVIWHWDIPDVDNKAKAALIGGKLDVLILTPLYLPDDGVEKYARLGFDHNPDVRLLVMEPWLPWDVYNPTTYAADYKPIAGEPAFMPKPAKVDHNAATAEGLQNMHAYFFKVWDEKLAAINKELGKQVIFVVPAGQAVNALREKVIAGQAPGIKTQEELFSDELGHPKAAMQVLETYCFYAVIYRKSPIGLPVPSTLAGAGFPADQVVPLNQLLQHLAWDAVVHHPMSGVTGVAD